MRRMVLRLLAATAVAVAVAGLPVAASAVAPLTVTKVRADWIGSAHKIFVDTTWTPKSYATKVTVKISVNGESLRTLQVKRWVIGHKLFKLTVPESVAAGSTARIEVRATSQAGSDHRTVSLDLP
jgi:hypothetical protein